MKKIMIGVFALAVVTAAFAFNNPFEHQQMDDDPVWYILQPNGNPDNPSHYSLATAGQEDACEGDMEVCAILAVPDASNGNKPRFDGSKTYDQALITAINQSQTGGQPDPDYVKERN